MRGGDGTDTPVGFATEDLLFVIGSRHRLYGVTVNVGRLATEILALLKRVVCINLRLIAVTWPCISVLFSSSAICCRCTKGATIS